MTRNLRHAGLTERLHRGTFRLNRSVAHKWFAGMLVAAVAGLATCTSNANLLSNGNLDQTYQQEIVPGFFLPKPALWINDGFRNNTGPYEDELSSEPWAGPAPTPVTVDDYGVFFKPFTGNLGTGDLAHGRLYQDVPGTPGLTYVLTGWAGAEPNYSGLIPNSPTKSLFSIEFFDAASSFLGGAVLDLAAAGLGTPNGQPFSYNQYSLSATAPGGTASVRVMISMVNAYANPLGGGQAFVVDDFELSAIPEPTTAALLGMGLLAFAAMRRRL
jgi:hypothetical protein